MTIHGSKGLEFPITIVSGLTTQHQAARRGIQVLWPAGQDTPEISLSKGVTTDGFDAHAELEGQMDRSEKDRLLYVACTRARDHLLVSGVHNTKPLSHARTLWELSDDTDVARAFEPPVVAPGMGADQLGLPMLDDTKAARDQFILDRGRLLAAGASLDGFGDMDCSHR